MIYWFARSTRTPQNLCHEETDPCCPQQLSAHSRSLPSPPRNSLTQWASAGDKAKFANALMKFIANEFPRQTFTQPLYRRLSKRDFDKVAFLEQTLSWPHFGDPTFTFSDVERAVKRRLRAAKVIDIFRCSRPTPPADASSPCSPACRRNTERGHRPPIPSPLAHRPRKPTLSVIH